MPFQANFTSAKHDVRSFPPSVLIDSVISPFESSVHPHFDDLDPYFVDLKMNRNVSDLDRGDSLYDNSEVAYCASHDPKRPYVVLRW